MSSDVRAGQRVVLELISRESPPLTARLPPYGHATGTTDENGFGAKLSALSVRTQAVPWQATSLLMLALVACLIVGVFVWGWAIFTGRRRIPPPHRPLSLPRFPGLHR